MASALMTVVATSWFRGEPGEGTDGMVSPGDTLKVDRARGAELKANGLVQDGSPLADVPAAVDAAIDVAKAPVPAKAGPITSASITKGKSP